MRRTPRIAVAIAAGVLLLPLTASAEEGAAPEAPELRTEPVWFTCEGETPEDTLNQNLFADHPTPSWTTEEPTSSVVDGEGCGSASPNAVGGTEQESRFDPSFAGPFDGVLDRVTVDLRNISLGTNRRTSGPITLNVRLSVDDESVFGLQEYSGIDPDTGESTTHFQPATVQVRVAPQPTGDTGAVERSTFTITDLDLLLPDDDVERRIVLTVATPLGTAIAQNVWVWGTTEAPAGLVFNPEEAEEVVVEAIPREEREPTPHD
jgi:hypothetical protein